MNINDKEFTEIKEITQLLCEHFQVAITTATHMLTTILTIQSTCGIIVYKVDSISPLSTCMYRFILYFA